MKDITKKALELGKQAFLGGKTSVPIHDKALMDLLRSTISIPGEYFNNTLPLLEAWSKGWHQENLK